MTTTYNGTCAASPMGTDKLPWCKVDARTCAHAPRQGKIFSKGPYNLCLEKNDATTLDTRARVRASHAYLHLA